jgi:apolipoprotein D and lipocalin family protein
LTWLLCALLVGCAQAPEGVEPIHGFDANRYLGTWYEIARLDNSFERGLSRVTATYTARPDGGIEVLNRGFDEASGTWSEAHGRAKFAGARDVGQLKVSFFGPFYGGYNIVDLDAAYSLALVVGGNRSYLWILSRTPNPPHASVERLVERARTLGFDVDKLVFVRQP